MKKQIRSFLLLLLAVVATTIALSCTPTTGRTAMHPQIEPKTISEVIVLYYEAGSPAMTCTDSYLLKTTFINGKEEGNIPGNAIMRLERLKDSRVATSENIKNIGISAETILKITSQILNADNKNAYGTEDDPDGDTVNWQYQNYDSGKSLLTITKRGTNVFRYVGKSNLAIGLVKQINMRATKYRV